MVKMFNLSKLKNYSMKNKVHMILKGGGIMRKLIGIILTVILLIVSGCSSSSKDTVTVIGEEKIAEDYVKSQGYKINEYKGEVEKYILEKDNLYGPASMKYEQIWAVQKEEPDKYFSKEIITYGFMIKKHPLQKRDSSAENGVNLYIMMTDGKIIGGFSYPNADVMGAVSSLDGKTLEEVKGVSFQKWSEEWNRKYGN